MATKPKTVPAPAEDTSVKGGADVETGQSTDDHAAVEELGPRANPLIDGVEGGQPRDGRGSVEGDIDAGRGDVERE